MKKLLLITILATFFIACSGNSNSNESNSPTGAESAPNSVPANSSEQITTKTPELPKVENQAETLTPLINAFCNAVNTGNNAALQKILSDATWKKYQQNATEDGMPSVAAWIKDSEPVGKQCLVINERIQGDVGEATVITETYPKGVPLKFVKENGSWRMTSESSDFTKVRSQAK